MSENEIRNACAEWLLYHGWLVLRINSGAAVSENAAGKVRFVSFSKWQVLGDDVHTDGISDLLAIHPDYPPLVIEAKMKGNHPTPAQLRFMAAWEAAGGRAIVARGIGDIESICQPKTDAKETK
jgi:hypothetical protein